MHQTISHFKDSFYAVIMLECKELGSTDFAYSVENLFPRTLLNRTKSLLQKACKISIYFSSHTDDCESIHS